MININYCMHTSVYFLGISLASMSLLGCQTTPIESSQQLPVVNNPTRNAPAPIADVVVKDTQVIQWANGYDWQLQQIVDAQGNTINVAAVPPITIDVAPDDITLTESCQRYSLSSLKILAPPFPNLSYDNLQVKSICADNSVNKVINADTDSNTNNDSTIKRVFSQTTLYNYNLKLLPLAQSQVQTMIDAAPKRLALNFENGASLIFTGTTKNLLKPTGLPINNELLERYWWRLVSAASNNYDNNGRLISRTPISDFYYPDFPITLNFSAERDQYASFQANCNGVGGPYALLKDNTLLIGSGLQTLMGCGFQGDKAETTLSALMARSKSKLILSLQPIKPTLKPSDDFPRYNLLQTMDSGETLVWQNEPLPEREYLTLENNEKTPETEINTSKSAQSSSNIDMPNE